MLNPLTYTDAAARTGGFMPGVSGNRRCRFVPSMWPTSMFSPRIMVHHADRKRRLDGDAAAERCSSILIVMATAMCAEAFTPNMACTKSPRPRDGRRRHKPYDEEHRKAVCAGKPHARFDEGRVAHPSRLLYPMAITGADRV
jgi:hypothetical protein